MNIPKQINKLTEAVTTLTSSHNANKLAVRSTLEPEASDNSDAEADEEEIDRQNRVILHENDL